MGIIFSSGPKSVKLSKVGAIFDGKVPEFLTLDRIFHALRLNHDDAANLLEVFKAISKIENVVSADQVLDYFELPRTEFFLKLFSTYYSFNTGGLEFKQFLVSVWDFCSLSSAYMVEYVFHLYDDDNSEAISSPAIRLMYFDIFNFASRPDAGIIEECVFDLLTKNDEIDMISFQEFCDDHSGFLRPVLDGYRQIRKKCLGEKVWKRLSRGRAEVMQWKYMDVMQIMSMTEAYSEYMEFDQVSESSSLEGASKGSLYNLGKAVEHSPPRLLSDRRGAMSESVTNCPIKRMIHSASHRGANHSMHEDNSETGLFASRHQSLDDIAPLPTIRGSALGVKFQQPSFLSQANASSSHTNYSTLVHGPQRRADSDLLRAADAGVERDEQEDIVVGGDGGGARKDDSGRQGLAQGAAAYRKGTCDHNHAKGNKIRPLRLGSVATSIVSTEGGSSFFLPTAASMDETTHEGDSSPAYSEMRPFYFNLMSTSPSTRSSPALTQFDGFGSARGGLGDRAGASSLSGMSAVTSHGSGIASPESAIDAISEKGKGSVPVPVSDQQPNMDATRGCQEYQI